MKLNSKVTWGFAWAGLALIVAVPSADFLTSGGGDKAAVLTSTTDPVQTASVTPGKPKGTASAPKSTAPTVSKPVRTASVTTTVTEKGVTITPAGSTPPVADPVGKYAGAGKPMPDYISDGDDAAAPKQETPPATQVASIDPVAPVPFPRWARPPDSVAPPISPEQPLIIESASPAPREASLDGPVPPEPVIYGPDDREGELLRDYLSNRGILDDGARRPRSSASVTVVDRPARGYDENGFYLSDGPNADSPARRANEFFDEDQYDGDFTLF